MSAAASSAAAAYVAGALPQRVKIKLSGRPKFVEVGIVEGDTVMRLAMRASSDLTWGVSADFLDLFVVKRADAVAPDDAPSPAQIKAVLDDKKNVLGEGKLLSEVGITSGAWVVARLAEASAAAPGECAGALFAARILDAFGRRDPFAMLTHLCPTLSSALPSCRRYGGGCRRGRQRRSDAVQRAHDWAAEA